MTGVGRNMRHCLTLLLVVLFIVQLFALTAYASSEKREYYFSFNGAGGQRYQGAIKSDLDEDSWGSAGISVLNAQYNGGSIQFYVVGPDGSQVTGASPYTSTTHDSLLVYYIADKKNTMWNGCNVTLVGNATAAVNYVQGNFQP